MSDSSKQAKQGDAAAGHPLTRDDSLREASEPLKQEGDALRDGSGSRQGQSPPNVGNTDPREDA